MSADLAYPELYPLSDKDGKNYRLLVNTNTDSWRFKILLNHLAAGEASCVQDGEVLSLQSFWIHKDVPVPQGRIAGLWRTITGAPPRLANFRGIGLGTALLQFIIRRARDFVASEIVIDFNAAGLDGDNLCKNWFQRRGFRFETSTEPSAPTTARLSLIPDSTEPEDPEPSASPGGPAGSRRPVLSPKQTKIRTPKPVATRWQSRAPLARMTTKTPRDFTKESLARLLRPISDLLNGKLEDTEGVLDPAIRDLFKASTTLVPHSRDTRVLQYHIWARDQPGIFHRHHFKYAIQYDPLGTMGGTATKNFTIEFFINKIRIYQERESMVKRVGRDLSRIRLPGFTLCETDRFFCFDHKFKASTDEALLREVRNYLFPLLNTVHPMFYRILDAYNLPLTKVQRRAVISGRKKLGSVDRTSPHYGKNPEFRREVSPALRMATFHRDGHICQHCERKLPLIRLHADHVLPVARGGLTVLGNLQALCGPCNLKKGKRLEAEL